MFQQYVSFIHNISYLRWKHAKNTNNLILLGFFFYSKVCEAGMYGNDCSQKCGACISSTACNHISGSCDLGCAPGWQNTPLCDEGTIALLNMFYDFIIHTVFLKQ